jgi:hypothetical protein
MTLFPVLEIIRLEENSEHGTFGVLRINKQVFCVTLELPDKLNATSISSIPAQQYECVRFQSPSFGDTFQVCGVPNRSAILFHAGNTDDNTRGCILLAEHYGKLGIDRAILNSGKTFKRFMQILSAETVLSLTIKEEY